MTTRSKCRGENSSNGNLFVKDTRWLTAAGAKRIRSVACSNVDVRSVSISIRMIAQGGAVGEGTICVL